MVLMKHDSNILHTLTSQPGMKHALLLPRSPRAAEDKLVWIARGSLAQRWEQRGARGARRAAPLAAPPAHTPPAPAPAPRIYQFATSCGIALVFALLKIFCTSPGVLQLAIEP